MSSYALPSNYFPFHVKCLEPNFTGLKSKNFMFDTIFHHYCHIFDNFVHFSFFFGLKYMNAFNVRERNNAKTCQTFKQLSKLSLFVCSLRHRVKYTYKKEKILQTENTITSNNYSSDLSLSTCSDPEKSKNTTWASRNSRSPPFPGMKVYDSRSRII